MVSSEKPTFPNSPSTKPFGRPQKVAFLPDVASKNNRLWHNRHNKDNEFKSFRMDNKYYDLLFELYIPDDESKTIELSLIISSDCQYNEYILLTVAIYAVKEVDSDNIYIYLEIIRILNYLYDQRRTKSNFVNIYNGKSLVCKKIEQNNDLFNTVCDFC